MDIGNESGEALYSNAGYRQVRGQRSTLLKLSGTRPSRLPSCSLGMGSHCMICVGPSALHQVGSGCGTVIEADFASCLHGFLWRALPS